MLVEQGITGVNRGGIDYNINRAGFGCPIENDLAAGFIELVRLLGKSEMAVTEMRISMAVIDVVGFGCGLGGGSINNKCRQGGKTFHIEAPCSGHKQRVICLLRQGENGF